MSAADPRPPAPVSRRRPPQVLSVVREPDDALRGASVDWTSWYLTDEDDMGESPELGEIIRLLIAVLSSLVRERGWDDAYVGGDNFFAWLEHEPLVRVSPDVFLLECSPDPMPRSFQTWRPGIRAPLLAVEVVSEDWRKDYALAPEKYDRLGVQELVIFDPGAAGGPDGRVLLQIYRRTGDGLFVRVSAGEGPAWSEALGAAFVFAPTERFRLLRLARDAEGTHWIPTPAEAAEREAESLRAELKRLRDERGTA